jgi:hypothetical protein
MAQTAKLTTMQTGWIEDAPMLFDDDFVQALRSEPLQGALTVCERTFAALDLNNEDGWQARDFDLMIEAYALLGEAMAAGLLPIALTVPEIQGTGAAECPKLYLFLSEVQALCAARAGELRLQVLRARFRHQIAGGFAYEFSQGDLERLLRLLGQIRERVTQAAALGKAYQARLLQRLTPLLEQTQKRVHDLTPYWGLVGEAGVVQGKLGADARPIVEGVKAITDILWQTQARAEELPSNSALPGL